MHCHIEKKYWIELVLFLRPKNAIKTLIGENRYYEIKSKLSLIWLKTRKGIKND